MAMASVLISIAKLCLVRYSARFARDVITWTLGPPAEEKYLEARRFGARGRNSGGYC